MRKTITQFRGAHWFLSNFYGQTVSYDGRAWPTAEHAYQAAKTYNEVAKEEIQRATSAARAKFIGQNVLLREDWESVKNSIMMDILRAKFRRDSVLASQLVLTGSALLIEGNAWGDRYWGQVRVGDQWVGENWLGRLLMERRTELRERKTLIDQMTETKPAPKPKTPRRDDDECPV